MDQRQIPSVRYIPPSVPKPQIQTKSGSVTRPQPQPPRKFWSCYKRVILDPHDDAPLDDVDRLNEANNFVEQLKVHCAVYLFQLFYPTKDTYGLHYRIYFETYHFMSITAIRNKIDPDLFCLESCDDGLTFVFTHTQHRKLGPWTNIKPAINLPAAPTMTFRLFVEACRNGKTDSDLWIEYPFMMLLYPDIPNNVRFNLRLNKLVSNYLSQTSI